MSPTQLQNSDRSLTYHLHKIVFVMDKIADQVLKNDLDFTHSQFKMLMAIDGKKVCQKEAAQYWEMTAAAVSRQIDLLVERKLVVREENPENRRQMMLSLTPTGKALLKKGFQKIDEKYEELYTLLTPTEKADLEKILNKMLKCVCNHGDDNSPPSCPSNT